jgi:pyruvate kinase
MLSDETATSKNWMNIIRWLDTFLKKLSKNTEIKKNDNDIFWKSIQQIQNIPIVIFTKKGYALEKIKQTSNANSLTVFTDNKKIKSFCDFKANTNCFLTKKFNRDKSSKYIYSNIKKYKKIIFSKENKAILIYVAYPRKKSRANTFSIISKKDF